MCDILGRMFYHGIAIPVVMVLLAALRFLTMLYAAPYLFGLVKPRWYLQSVEALDGYVTHLHEVIAL